MIRVIVSVTSTDGLLLFEHFAVIEHRPDILGEPVSELQTAKAIRNALEVRWDTEDLT